jgi:hypothetical protein
VAVGARLVGAVGGGTLSADTLGGVLGIVCDGFW